MSDPSGSGGQRSPAGAAWREMTGRQARTSPRDDAIGRPAVPWRRDRPGDECVAEPVRHRLRIWLPVAAVVSLVAPALGFLYGLRLVFAILFIDDDVDKAYNAAGDALTLVCLFALVFTVAATASTLTFYRLGRLRDARRTVVLAGIAVLIPALGTLVTYLVLPPIPGR